MLVWNDYPFGRLTLCTTVLIGYPFFHLFFMKLLPGVCSCVSYQNACTRYWVVPLSCLEHFARYASASNPCQIIFRDTADPGLPHPQRLWLSRRQAPMLDQGYFTS
jgi:hypothetical protein